MNDYLRESLSYFGLWMELRKVKKVIEPEVISFGKDKNQYFCYYEPRRQKSDKVIVWVHGGGWNAGSPKDFDFVGQCIAQAGYRFVSLGYRLAPKNKYPSQIEDVCVGFKRAMHYLNDQGMDMSQVIVCGPSAGAHLSSIMTYSREVQDKYELDPSNVIGYVGWGGPYCINEKSSRTLKILWNQLFYEGYDRKRAEPVTLLCKSDIPMLLIQSRHDGLIDFSYAEAFRDRAASLGIPCELYEVVDRLNTHSWYTAGMFLKTRKENQGLNKFFTWVENL